jgi:anthranilate synthase/aminodeoxychorismate synthase-like glutamine amidotransferase
MILVLDNYDSFTYNLVQYIGELTTDLQVYRNDAIDLAGIMALKPTGIVISPGPGRPENAGLSISLIQEFAPELPILGVCLGHQAIGAAYGGKIVNAPEIVHGKTSAIHHNRQQLFDGMPEPFQATRYHSLIVEAETLPDELEIIATSDNGLVMGLTHRQHQTWGVQFHPESIMTESGKKLVANFIKCTK